VKVEAKSRCVRATNTTSTFGLNTGDMAQISVLVVCLGNICRSPMGEAVLQHVAKERGLDITVDSAGTAGYHIGEDPDERCDLLPCIDTK
jgi:hypothetical protein